MFDRSKFPICFLICFDLQFYILDIWKIRRVVSLLKPGTNWTKEYWLHLNILVDGIKIAAVNNPKILAVHCRGTEPQEDQSLKSLAGSTWDNDEETLLATYKAIRWPSTDHKLHSSNTVARMQQDGAEEDLNLPEHSTPDNQRMSLEVPIENR